MYADNLVKVLLCDGKADVRAVIPRNFLPFLPTP